MHRSAILSVVREYLTAERDLAEARSHADPERLRCIPGNGYTAREVLEETSRRTSRLRAAEARWQQLQREADTGDAGPDRFTEYDEARS